MRAAGAVGFCILHATFTGRNIYHRTGHAIPAIGRCVCRFRWLLGCSLTLTKPRCSGVWMRATSQRWKVPRTVAYSPRSNRTDPHLRRLSGQLLLAGVYAQNPITELISVNAIFQQLGLYVAKRKTAPHYHLVMICVGTRRGFVCCAPASSSFTC
jgi:hypothetical protein